MLDQARGMMGDSKLELIKAQHKLGRFGLRHNRKGRPDLRPN